MSSSISPVRNQPSPGLVAQRYDFRCHFSQVFDVRRWVEVFAFFESFCCRGAEPFQRFYADVSKGCFFLGKAKLLYLEILVVEAIKEKVQKVRHNSLCAFAFQKVYQVVVGCRKEFHENFSYDTDAGFFNI